MKKPKILLWDLEICRILDMPTRKWFGMSQFYGRTMNADINTIINFGYKWLGDDKAECINAWDFPGWKVSVNDDGELVAAAYAILSEADAIVTHYGKKFDLPFFNSRAMYHGFPPLPTIPHIDTKTVASRKLKLFSNKLDEVAAFFGLEQKLSTGPQLWDGVLNRDQESMDKMSKYCAQDVEVLEQVYRKLLPLMNNIPNYNLFAGGEGIICSSCGGSDIQKYGFKYTKTTKVQKYLCKGCGSISSRGANDNKILRAV